MTSTLKLKESLHLISHSSTAPNLQQVVNGQNQNPAINPQQHQGIFPLIPLAQRPEHNHQLEEKIHSYRQRLCLNHLVFL